MKKEPVNNTEMFTTLEAAFDKAMETGTCGPCEECGSPTESGLQIEYAHCTNEECGNTQYKVGMSAKDHIDIFEKAK